MRKASLFILCMSILICSATLAMANDKELFIYCGVTMKAPITDLAVEFEKNHDCKVVIKPGGSGNLLSELSSTKRGDLFLPGSDSYVAKAEKKGLISAKKLVGYNKAAMMVQKGNPKSIAATLDSLTDPKYRVVIGNPKSGSIGKETSKILKKKGIYDEVIENAQDLATASPTLISVLKEDKADIVINWYATATWEGNSSFISVIPIKDEYASKKKLVLSVLSFSKDQELAKQFLELASSEHGRETFNKYGLYDIE